MIQCAVVRSSLTGKVRGRGSRASVHCLPSRCRKQPLSSGLSGSRLVRYPLTASVTRLGCTIIRYPEEKGFIRPGTRLPLDLRRNADGEITSAPQSRSNLLASRREDVSLLSYRTRRAMVSWPSAQTYSHKRRGVADWQTVHAVPPRHLSDPAAVSPHLRHHWPWVLRIVG